MVGVRRMASVPAGLILLASGLSPANGQSFVDAPIACSQRLPYKTCTADFDGWTLRISQRYPEGQDVVAVYKRCAVDTLGIHCASGEWRSGGVHGPLGRLSIGLRDGLPFPK
jgi:hypothetical protein